MAGREILAAATVEEHEEISTGKRPGAARGANPPLPLSERAFDFKAENVPLKDVLAEIEKSGVKFKFDAQALADAGIDFDRFVDLHVRKLNANDFFHRVFDPVGLKFKIDGLTVTLTPK